VSVRFLPGHERFTSIFQHAEWTTDWNFGGLLPAAELAKEPLRIADLPGTCPRRCQFPVSPYLGTLNSSRLSGVPTHSCEKTLFPDHDFLGVAISMRLTARTDSVAHRRLGDTLY
jgi:hypothetical protein